jgi:hypothetical protein
MSFERELAAYRRELPRLLDRSGKFALVHGDEVVSNWDTYADALQEGYRRFGLDTFIVKQIQAVELVHFVTREITPVCQSWRLYWRLMDRSSNWPSVWANRAKMQCERPISQFLHRFDCALVDTGASCTCIVAGVLAPLGLVATGTVPISTPSTGTTPATCNQYDVSMAIIHPALNLLFGAIPIVECQPLAGPYHGLLGRDLLRHCLLVYDGNAERFSLAF